MGIKDRVFLFNKPHVKNQKERINLQGIVEKVNVDRTFFHTKIQ